MVILRSVRTVLIFIVHNGTVFITSSESVYNEIREKILSGELESGQHLSMRKMAALAGTSVSPVTEAFKKLEEDGLIESQPKWGARVAVYTKEKIEDFLMLRMAIECQIIRILAERMTEEQYSECKKITEKLDSYKFSETDLTEISNLHIKLHSRLAEMAEYPSLTKMLKRCHLSWLFINSNRKRSTFHEELPPNWHGRLLDVIMERNPDKAEALMRDHVNDLFKDYV